jgi:hypothetical protein
MRMAQLRGALIIELGTMHGGSAIALASAHESNKVVTYNVVDDFTVSGHACLPLHAATMTSLHTSGDVLSRRLLLTCLFPTQPNAAACGVSNDGFRSQVRAAGMDLGMPRVVEEVWCV